jgi:hypothetical protein
MTSSVRLAGAPHNPKETRKMTTKISPLDLGATVCRALMRDMNDKPIRLALYNPKTASDDYEYTSARKVADQWTVTLLPTLDFVTVSATGKFWGMGMWDQIDVGGVNHIGPEYDYVTYPEDSAQITGDEYVTRLRSVVERALKAVEDAYAAKRAASR